MTLVNNAGSGCVEVLKNAGIGSVFQIPGESFLPVLRALYDEKASISTVTCRQEGEAGFAALGYAEYTGKPGVMAVTRGPGASNALIALHTAKEMSLPLVMLMGQVPTGYIDSKLQANQYMDPEAVFGSVTKKVLKPRTPQEVVDAVKEALECSVNGRPGPVVVELPIDILNTKENLVVPPVTLIRNPIEPDDKLIEEAAQAIAAAERPLTITGELLQFENLNEKLAKAMKASNNGHDRGSLADRFNHFVERIGSGVLTIFREQDMFPNKDPHYIGNLGLKHPPHVKEALKVSDVVLVAGHRFTQETTANYDPELMKDKTVIQIYPDLGEEVTDNIYSHEPKAKRPAKKVIRIQGDVSTVIDKIEKRVAQIRRERVANISPDWPAQYHTLQREYAAVKPENEFAGDVDMTQIVTEIGKAINDNDALLVHDAGSNTSWVSRHLGFDKPHSLFAVENGAMGYAVPVSVGIKQAMTGDNTDKPIVCMVGDGSFMMTGLQGLATACQQKHRKLVVVLCDNGAYGTIANHELNANFHERHGVTLDSPNYTTMVSAFKGCHTATVVRTEEFAPEMDAAMKRDGISFIHVKYDPRNIGADMMPLKDPVAFCAL